MKGGFYIKQDIEAELHNQKLISVFQGDGTGVLSIYGGGSFADENFELSHDSPGLLSMVTYITGLYIIQLENILTSKLKGKLATNILVNFFPCFRSNHLGSFWFLWNIDEKFRHFQANSGQDTNGCQFFVTCAKCNFLDGKHVVFGRVIDGILVMRKIENVPTGPNNKPKIPVLISQCGQM